MPAWVGVVALVAMGVAVYSPALGGGFVFDDHALIEEGRWLRGPIESVWSGTGTPDYWPLTYSLLWLEWRAFGTAPFGYHVVTLALHLLTALLFWKLLRRMGAPGAWLAAVVFTIHPVAVESVAWISEIKNTFSAVFAVAAALTWLTFLEKRSGKWYVATLVLLAAGLLAKASVVVLVPVMLALAVRADGHLERRDLIALVPLAALGTAAAAATIWFQHERAMGGPTSRFRDWPLRLGEAGWALLTYLRTAYVPVDLALLYPPWPVAPGSALFWLPLGVILIGSAALWRARTGPWRPVVVALAYSTVCVLPVLGLVDMAILRLTPVANHLQYLALLGPSALAGWAGARLLDRWPRIGGWVAAMGMAALGLGTFDRARAFRDDETLWAAAVRQAPRSPVALREHGNQLIASGSEKAGLAELSRAAEVASDPGLRSAIRAEVLQVSGREAEAAVEARRVLAMTDNPSLQSDAAWVLLQVGSTEEAIEAYSGLRRRVPAASEYAYRFSVALARAGRRPEAIEELYRYARSYPGHPRIESALAFLLVRSGRGDEARQRAASVLGVAPSDPATDELLHQWLEAAGAGN